MNTQCEEDDDYLSVCDNLVIIDESYYNTFDSGNFTFIDAEVIDNCLSVTISASGCDGNSWAYNLVDSGSIAESLPEQRYLKLELLNEEACLAVFKRTVSFDLTPIKIEGSNEIILNIEGFESSINYKY
ncbi:hypothetical protein [uncultured Algibacter sp.]|uniref:hypothetical protein n=1 Tax=uncultured Algibacter sp. TaxID=298659 RepID=UPI002637A27B|nr:hypothetical protein [uncultured Algibacter sp.]